MTFRESCIPNAITIANGNGQDYSSVDPRIQLTTIKRRSTEFCSALVENGGRQVTDITDGPENRCENMEFNSYCYTENKPRTFQPQRSWTPMHDGLTE